MDAMGTPGRIPLKPNETWRLKTKVIWLREAVVLAKAHSTHATTHRMKAYLAYFTLPPVALVSWRTPAHPAQHPKRMTDVKPNLLHVSSASLPGMPGHWYCVICQAAGPNRWLKISALGARTA